MPKAKIEQANASPEQAKASTVIPKPMGRPRMPFDQGIADYVCEQLITPRSLSNICRDPGMPDRGTIMRWVLDFPDFDRDYTRARDLQVEAHVDDIPDISDDGRNDWMERQNFDGAEIGWHVNGEAMARSRLRIDTRKWIAAQMKPKKYGIHVAVDQTVGVTNDLGALLVRVGTQGTRLVPGIDLVPNVKDEDE
jgi:hypothetical protein